MHDVKKVLAMAAGLTAVIVFGCYFLFGLHMLNPLRGFLGLSVPTLVVLDEVPTALFFQKIVPFSKETGIPIGTFVRQGGVVNWQAMAGKTLKESLAEGVEAVPVLKTLKKNDPLLQNPDEVAKKIAQEKQFFSRSGLNTDYFGYSWIRRQAQLSRPHMPKYCRGAIYYPGRSSSHNEWPPKDKYMLAACVAGNGHKDWSVAAKIYLDNVNLSNSLGILVIQSWRRKQFTDQEFANFKKVLQYAKKHGVKIVTLHEAMEKALGDRS